MDILHWIHENVTRLHIVAGSCGLLLFWIPVITRKGNLNHKKFGRYFANIMYAVGFSSATMSSMDQIYSIPVSVAPRDMISASSFVILVITLSSAAG